MRNSSAEVFEDGIDLQIGLVEATLLEGPRAWPGYPFPRLKPTAEQEMRTFRTIVLENPYLRATLLPGMGGRIISLLDKRTGTEVLQRHRMIEPQEGGRRGAYVREGIQLSLDGRERLNSMGNVASHVEPSDEDSDEVAVWIAETCTGTGLSFHKRISLAASRAELKIEARVLNRSFRPVSYNASIDAYVGDGEIEGPAFYTHDREAGLAVVPEGQTFDGVTLRDGVYSVSRFGGLRQLAPRQVDSWKVALYPLTAIGGCTGVSPAMAAYVRHGKLRLHAFEQRLGHKLLLLTADGQTLEATVDLYPENLLEIPLEGLEPVEIVLRNPAKEEVFRTSCGPTVGECAAPEIVCESNCAVAPTIGLESARPELLRATFDVGIRHAAYALLGLQSLASGNYLEANGSFESALNFNAEDPLLWWSKAVAARLDEQDNQAELLNAHYLAPLEPVLRSESFLSQPLNLDPEPNPLLAPLQENPEEFVEVACLLIECGLFDQAGRWLDEALRHRDLQMLRYLLAYCLLVSAKLPIEASEHVRLAASTALGPPFPFRDIERKAILTLAEAFPADRSLKLLSSFLEAST